MKVQRSAGSEVHEFRGHGFIITPKGNCVFEVALEGVKDVWKRGTQEQQMTLWQCGLSVVTRHSEWPGRKMAITTDSPLSPDGLLLKPWDC